MIRIPRFLFMTHILLSSVPGQVAEAAVAAEDPMAVEVAVAAEAPVTAEAVASPPPSDSVPGRSVGGRFYHPPEGFIPTQALPEDFHARVRGIRLDRKDAFEGSVAHTRAERKLFGVGNRLHILSRESTLRRRLLFSEGVAIDKDRLAETERALRAEEFLSDAVIAVRPLPGGECDVLVTTFDQWTLVPGAGVTIQNLKPSDVYLWRWNRILEDEWLWWAGVFETNLLGTGTRVGAAVRHDLERDAVLGVFNNNNLTPLKLQVGAEAAWLSDGDSLYLRLGKPLLSRSDRYGYSLSVTSRELSERVYFDANNLDALPRGIADTAAGSPHLLRLFDRVATRDVQADAVRSFGSSLKLNVGPTFRYLGHHDVGGLGDADTALSPYAPLPASALDPEPRTDVLIGASISLSRYGYRTARNFRNLKWNESLETGWRLTTKAAFNQPWLGARDRDLQLVQEAALSRFLGDAFYLSGACSWQAFLSSGGDLRDGRTEARGEASWREHPLTATWISASWSGLFATPRSVQLPLGELTGLPGYPSFYYAGQARFLASAEQRLFPEFEFATLVPAFSAFVAAGNTFPSREDFDPSRLHWSAGLGLRLGRSKSVQKTVQHINVNFPIGDRYLKGPVVSILARKSL